MNRRFALALALSTVGCGQADPCAGYNGACIALHVRGNVGALDQLAVTVDDPALETQKTTPPAPFSLPAQLALHLPSGATRMVHIGVVALAHGMLIARGTGQATLASNRGTATVSLTPATTGGDMGILPGAPSAPTNVLATGGSAQATVTWSAPDSQGASPITSYTVTSSPGGIEVTTTTATNMATVAGLTNGTTYTFSVVATNAAGTGPAGTSNPVTPSATPMAPATPTSVMAAANIDRGATVSWTPPSTDGTAPITMYTVTPSPSGSAVVVPGTATSAQVTGLTPGMSYQFTVYASNAVGAGPASISINSVIVLAKLVAPGSLSACGANGRISLTFTPVPGEQSYDVFYNTSAPATAGSRANVTGSPTTITVPSGNYHVVVAAVNALGDGAFSSEVTAFADSQIHDTLFVTTDNNWNAFDCFSQVPDGTNTPTRSVPGSFSGLAVDSVNAVVWVIGSSGVLGFVDATHANGTINATYTMGTPAGMSTLYQVAIDNAHHKFYLMSFCTAGNCSGGSYPLQRFAYSAPSDLNTATPMSEASFATPANSSTSTPLEFFVNEATGDIWGAFISGSATGQIAFYSAAQNLADNSSPAKTFTLTGGVNDSPASVVYSPAAGGTIYASWFVGSSSSTQYVTGIDSSAGGQVNATGTFTQSVGALAISSSTLMVSTSSGIQVWSLSAPGNKPLKTVSVPDTVHNIFYVP